MKRQLKLDYTLQFGVLNPYAEAVRDGIALASACHECGFASFPPRAVCPRCESERFDWKQLSGAALIVERTGESPCGFALAQFDGADTQTLVRLHAIPSGTTRGQLVPPRDELIGLWLSASAPEAGKEDQCSTI